MNMCPKNGTLPPPSSEGRQDPFACGKLISELFKMHEHAIQLGIL